MKREMVGCSLSQMQLLSNPRFLCCNLFNSIHCSVILDAIYWGKRAPTVVEGRRVEQLYLSTSHPLFSTLRMCIVLNANFEFSNTMSPYMNMTFTFSPLHGLSVPN